jgi:hypothetical protein
MQTPKIKKTPSPDLTHATGCKNLRLKTTPSTDLKHAIGYKHPILKNPHHLILHMQQDANTQD